MTSEYHVGDLCSFAKGASVPRDRMRSQGLLYLHYGDLYTGHNLYIDIENPEKPLPFIDSTEKLRNDQFVDDGDIIYVLTSETVDDLGKSLCLNNPKRKTVVAGTETTVMRINRRDIIEPRYLNYLLQTPLFQRKLRQYVTGMKVFRVHPRDIAKITISIPSLTKQKKIIALLDSIYSKIRLDQQINDHLAKLVSSEFGRRYDQTTPKIKLGNVLSISTKTLKPENCGGEIWEHYSIPAFDATHSPVFEAAEGIKSSKFVIDDSCILVSKLNPSTKRIWLPTCYSSRAVCSTEFIVYKPHQPHHKSYYYAAICAPAFTDFLLAHVTGSTGSRQRTKPSTTLAYPMPFPGIDEINSFCQFADPIYRQIQINESATKKLEGLRDTLLPKLMSGEIDVSQIDLRQLNGHLCDCLV